MVYSRQLSWLSRPAGYRGWIAHCPRPQPLLLRSGRRNTTASQPPPPSTTHSHWLTDWSDSRAALHDPIVDGGLWGAGVGRMRRHHSWFDPRVCACVSRLFMSDTWRKVPDGFARRGGVYVHMMGRLGATELKSNVDCGLRKIIYQEFEWDTVLTLFFIIWG